MSRRLNDVRLAVMMLGGGGIAERTHVVALGNHHQGRQHRAQRDGSRGHARASITLIAWSSGCGEGLLLLLGVGMSAQGHRAAVVAVTERQAIAVVLALRTDD